MGREGGREKGGRDGEGVKEGVEGGRKGRGGRDMGGGWEGEGEGGRTGEEGGGREGCTNQYILGPVYSPIQYILGPVYSNPIHTWPSILQSNTYLAQYTPIQIQYSIKRKLPYLLAAKGVSIRTRAVIMNLLTSTNTTNAKRVRVRGIRGHSRQKTQSCQSNASIRGDQWHVVLESQVPINEIAEFLHQEGKPSLLLQSYK